MEAAATMEHRTYADDLAELIEALDLEDAVLVGHGAGGGEVARYVGRHGTSRVAKAMLVDAVAPLMLKTEANPRGLPIEDFDELRAAVAADRSVLAVLRPAVDSPSYRVGGGYWPTADPAEKGGMG